MASSRIDSSSQQIPADTGIGVLATSEDDQLGKLLTAVTSAPKYRHIAPDLIRRVGTRELAVRRNLKEAIKATKNKLHQVGGAYFESRIDYEQALTRLRDTAVDPHAFHLACREIMQQHASTRERLSILDDFYAVTLAGLPPIHTVIDVACGLNPLAIPWLPLAPGAAYLAYDVYADLVAFLHAFLPLAGVNGAAEARDVVSRPPDRPADLALLLKTLPVLEQIEKTAVSRLLDTLRARYLLITFPVHSLGGRRKGMVESYEAQFYEWINGRSWRARRFLFPTELAFLVERHANAEGNWVIT